MLGAIGALLGGFLGGLIFHVGYDGFFPLQSWILPIAGPILVRVTSGLAPALR